MLRCFKHIIFFKFSSFLRITDKRRKDIARFSGAEVDETGIGSGEVSSSKYQSNLSSVSLDSAQGSVPVESSDRDWMFMPVLFVCAFTITALVSVLAVSPAFRASYTTAG